MVLNQDDLQLIARGLHSFVLLRCIHLATTLMIEQEHLHSFNVINLQATTPHLQECEQLAVLCWSELMGTIIYKIAVLSPSGICPWHSSIRWAGEGIVHAVAGKHWRWTELTKYAT